MRFTGDNGVLTCIIGSKGAWGELVDDLAVLCKSYRRDLDQCALLVESIRQHNQDDVPFYLCVPRADRYHFANRIGANGVLYVSDEEIAGGPARQSWVRQQLVKLRFAERGLTANYLWIDSDFVVLRNFRRAEFFAYPGVPYTVISEVRRDPFCEKLLGNALDDPEYARMLEGVHAAYAVIRDWFGRSGPSYYFGAPAIWSSAVVRELEAAVRDRGFTFESMLRLAPFEMQWYGEFLLSHAPIPVVPRSGMAVCFTRDWQYRRFLASGLTLDDFAAAGYLAVNFAAKWMISSTATPFDSGHLRGRSLPRMSRR